MNLILENVTQHNLRIKKLEIPLHQLVGVCGPSGSGKSSLVVHTIFAESQRRYFSSLSTYQRQFFERWARPQVENIHNLGASLLVGQKNVIRNSRATVATTAGLLPLLCNLYAYGGEKFCPACGSKIVMWDGAALHQKLVPFQEELWLGFPVSLSGQKEVFEDEVKVFLKQGLNRICILPEFRFQELSDPHVIETLSGKDVVFICDRVPGSSLTGDQVDEAIRLALPWSTRLCVVRPEAQAWEMHSIQDACAHCGSHYGPLYPDHFSYTSSVGSCPECKGFGAKREVDLVEVASRMDATKSLEGGFFSFLETPRFRPKRQRLLAMVAQHGVPINVAWRELNTKQQEQVLFGEGSWKGLKHLFDRLEQKKYKMHVRIFLNRYYSEKECKSCQGTRLVPKSRLVKVQGKPIHEVMMFNIEQLSDWVRLAHGGGVSDDILNPLKSRLDQLMRLGLGYLILNRKSRSLSGGEVQRLSLVHHIGTGLSDTLYVLDEPSIGLHPRDSENLVKVCQALVVHGNHCLVIEHDTGILSHLDSVLEMGPSSGRDGGTVVWQGSARQWAHRIQSPKYKKRVFHKPYTPSFQKWIQMKGASGHNLKEVSCQIPENCLVGVCGVSGSGKTTLILKTLVPYLEYQFGKSSDERPLPVQEISLSARGIADVEYISQDLPVRSSRANLLTYTGAFDLIRKHFASSPDAKSKKLKPGHFSFNSDLGRCAVCKGMGEVVVEMIFMEDLHIPCDECMGLRFQQRVLDVRYRHKTISEILDMTVDELCEFFDHDARLKFILTTLKSVGLGYLRAGQGCHTYSGGELQRLKISGIFLHPTKRKVLYVLDEPTTGLHAGEVRQLLFLFGQMIKQGHTVLVIEHHPEVLAACDYLIELGPGGGDRGGEVIFEGSPRDLISHKDSPTAPYLAIANL